MVQAVAAFVEQGDHIVMAEQGRLATHAIGKVAHQMGDGRLQLAVVWAQPTGAHIVHPGATAFARTRTRVEVKLANQLASAFDAVKAHAGVPSGRGVGTDADFEQGLHNFEQAGQYLGGGEVGFDVLVAEGVARFFELFADVGPVPGLRVFQFQMLGSEGAHFGHIALSTGAGALGQVAQKRHHVFW